jgi:hypothetical protein
MTILYDTLDMNQASDQERERRTLAELPELTIVDGQIVLMNQKDPVWTSKDGSRTPIIEMDDSHLWNAARKLIQDGDRGSSHPLYPEIIDESARRGLCLHVKPSVLKMKGAIRSLRSRSRPARHTV